MQIRLMVNGKAVTVETDPERPLLEVLREELGLHGTRFGCGEGDCGACSVLVGGVGGKRVFSCQTSVGDAAGKEIVTVEGLASGGKLHPVQEAFLAEGAYQCGYCISGMVVAAVGLLNEKPRPTEAEIREGMQGNLCRCCGYARIVKAVERAALGKGGGR